MGLTYLFKAKTNHSHMDVVKSYHTNVSRTKDVFVRDLFIDNSRYKEIISQAIHHGLTSFRNKGRVVVTFKDSWGLYYGLLVELDDSKIVIVTVFNSKKYGFWTFFSRVQNRINLGYYYTMKCMTREELSTKKLESSNLHIDISSTKEDKDFNKYTSFNGIKKL